MIRYCVGTIGMLEEDLPSQLSSDVKELMHWWDDILQEVTTAKQF